MNLNQNNIHITQCCCSNHHCVAAAAWEEPHYTLETMVAVFKNSIATAINNRLINPWCGICHNDTFIYIDEVVTSSFEDAVQRALEIQAESFKAKRELDILRN
jgi:hypothetical protein